MSSDLWATSKKEAQRHNDPSALDGTAETVKSMTRCCVSKEAKTLFKAAVRFSRERTHSGTLKGVAQTQEADGMQPDSLNDHKLQCQLCFTEKEERAKSQEAAASFPCPMAGEFDKRTLTLSTQPILLSLLEGQACLRN